MGLCPFQVVYAVLPRGPADLLQLPLPVRADVLAVDLMDSLTRTHASTHARLEEANARYKEAVDRHRRQVVYI